MGIFNQSPEENKKKPASSGGIFSSPKAPVDQEPALVQNAVSKVLGKTKGFLTSKQGDLQPKKKSLLTPLAPSAGTEVKQIGDVVEELPRGVYKGAAALPSGILSTIKSIKSLTQGAVKNKISGGVGYKLLSKVLPEAVTAPIDTVTDKAKDAVSKVTSFQDVILESAKKVTDEKLKNPAFENIEARREKKGDVLSGAERFMDGLGYTIISMAPAIASAGLGAGASSSALIGGLIEAGQNTDQLGDEIDARTDLTDQQKQDRKDTMFVSSLVVSSLANRFGIFGDTKSLFRRILNTELTEIPEEVGIQALQNMLADKPVKQGLGETALFTAIMAPLLGGAGHLVKKTPEKTILKSLENNEVFNTLNDEQKNEVVTTIMQMQQNIVETSDIEQIASQVQQQADTTPEAPKFNAQEDALINEIQSGKYKSAEEYADAKIRGEDPYNVKQESDVFIDNEGKTTFTRNDSKGNKVTVGTLSDVSPGVRKEYNEAKVALEKAKGTGMENTKSAGDRYFAAKAAVDAELFSDEISKKNQYINDYNKAVGGDTSPAFKREVSPAKELVDKMNLSSDQQELQAKLVLALQQGSDADIRAVQKEIRDSFTPEQKKLFDELKDNGNNTIYGKPNEMGVNERRVQTSGKGVQSSKGEALGGEDKNVPWSNIQASRRLSENSTGKGGSITELAQAHGISILNTEFSESIDDSVPITEDTFKVLKVWDFPDTFISSLKDYYKRGAVSKIKFQRKIRGKDVSGAYGKDTLIINPSEYKDSFIASDEFSDHELGGHAWYDKLNQNDRLTFFNEGVLKDKKVVIEAWEKSATNYQYYWVDTVENIGERISDIVKSNARANEIMQDAGLFLMDGYTLDEMVEHSFNLQSIIKSIDDTLTSLGFEKTNIRYNMLTISQEHVGLLAEQAKNIKATIPMVKEYLSQVTNGTLEFNTVQSKKLNVERPTSARMKLDERTPQEILTEAEAKAAPFSKDGPMPKTGPMSIAQAKTVAKDAASIDDFEAILKGGEDAVQPFYVEDEPVSITNKYYDQLVTEMRDSGYTSISDFYYKENAPIKNAVVEKPVQKVLKAPTVGVSNKEVPMDDADSEKIALIQEMKSNLKEQLNSHPGKKLQRFISKKEGQFLDERGIYAKTPAQAERIRQINAERAKKIMLSMDEMGVGNIGISFDDPDAIREKIDEYQRLKADYVDLISQEKMIKLEIRERQLLRKNEVALEKILDKNQILLEKQILTEQQRKRKETLTKSIEEREAKLLEIAKRVRDQADRITEAQQTPLPKPLNFFKKIDRQLRPLKYVDDKTKDIFKEWKADSIVGTVDADVEAKKLAYIPARDGFGAILDYQAGRGKYKPQIKKVFDDLYDLAEKEMGYNLPSELATPDSDGFLNYSEAQVKELPYLKNYLPQVWADNADQMKSAVQKFLEAKGLAPEQIKEYVDGKALTTETASRLKLNPRFQKEKVFPTYEIGMQHGLTPKFTHPAQLAGWYMDEMRKAQANRKFLDNLLDQAKIMPADAAPSGWKTIEAPFIKGEVYKAPPRLAELFNGLFRDEENLDVGQTVLKGVGWLSGTAQDLILTSGVPYTQINSFSLGTAILDLTRGDLKSAKAILRSNSNEASRKFFESHVDDIYRMARQGIDVGRTVSSYENAWKVNKADPQFYNKFIHTVGDIGNDAFTAKIFNSYIPQVMVQIYSDSYKRLIKAGVPPLSAERQAANILRTTRAISENEPFRSKGFQDFMRAFFFAPRYREAMIKVYGNTLRSVTTKMRDPKFRNLRKLFIGAVITYMLYNFINYENNDEFMWENEPGHEFDLKFQGADGTFYYTPFLGSTSAVVRNIGSGILAGLKGDTKTAGQKLGALFSVPIKTTAELLSNRDYFGNEIYKETDTGEQRAKKMAAYVGIAINHPYISNLMKYLSGKQPGYQSLSYAVELPIKYSSRDKEAVKEFYNEQDKTAKENARKKDKIRPIFEQIKEVGFSSPEAKQIYMDNIKNAEDDKIYQDMKKADKALETRKNTARIYGIVKQIDKLGFTSPEAAQIYADNIKTAQDDEIYQRTKKNYLKEKETGIPTGYMGQTDDRPIVEQISTYAKALAIDPVTAFQRIVSGQHIKDVNGNAIVVNRIAYKDPEGVDSTEIKNQLGAFSNKNGEQQILEHRIPLILGGDNSPENLYLVPKSVHDSWTPIEIYLGNQVRDGIMSKKQAQEIILEVRDGMTFEEVKAIKPKKEFFK